MQITELPKNYQLSDVKAIDANGNTILHLVAEDEKLTSQELIEILTKLLDNGLDPNSVNQKNENILDLVIKTKKRDVIDFLLTRKVHLDNLAAIYFIENEYKNLLQLKNQSEYSNDEMQKQEVESASFFEWMITKGLDIDRPNLSGQSALFLALDYNLQHLLPVLLKYTKQINYIEYSSGRTLLHIILENKVKTRWSSSYTQRYATTVVKILLDRGISPESVDKSLNKALHQSSVDYASYHVVQMLIDHTTNLDRQINTNETRYSRMTREDSDQSKLNLFDYRKIFQSLMMKDADVDEKNQSGFRPLHIFAKETGSRKYLEDDENMLFKMLIRIGCNVNVEDSHGRTPLHIAAKGCNEELVKELIDNGAQINCRDSDGATPLHLAVCANNSEGGIVGLLVLTYGADVNVKDCEGLTPLYKIMANMDSGITHRWDCSNMNILLTPEANKCFEKFIRSGIVELMLRTQ